MRLSCEDATGLSRGVSRLWIREAKKPECQMPRACPVESHGRSYIAANVNLHGTSPWHPEEMFRRL